MNTEDWEKFERFGVSEGPFIPLHESSMMLGKYKTDRRDKRAIRVAAYAPLAGAALGAAHGNTAAHEYIDKVNIRKAAAGQRKSDRNAKGLGPSIARKGRLVSQSAHKAVHVPGKTVEKGKAAIHSVSAPTTPHKYNGPKVQISPSKSTEVIDKASRFGKGILGKINKVGAGHYSKIAGGSATGKAAFNIAKKHTIAGAVAGTAFVPLHSAMRLHHKNKARREEIGKRTQF
jgi:hypothetical protein